MAETGKLIDRPPQKSQIGQQDEPSSQNNKDEEFENSNFDLDNDDTLRTQGDTDTMTREVPEFSSREPS